MNDDDDAKHYALMFLLVYHAFLLSHKANKPMGSFEPLIATLYDIDLDNLTFSDEPCSVDLADVIYADDHNAFLIFEGVNDVKLFLTQLFSSQHMHSFETNFDKSALMIHCVGKGSKRLKAQFGNHISVPGYGNVNIVDYGVHLGTQVDSNLSPMRDVKNGPP